MGPNPSDDRVRVPLDILPFPRLVEEPGGTACPHCAASLTLHQPDLEMADRLLGTCDGCKRWYLVDLLPGRDDGFLVEMPDRELVRALSRPDPSGGISLMGAEPDPGPGRKPGK